jgi:small GTP-binding protein
MRKTASDVSILLLGNSGVGKTLICRCIANGGSLEQFQTEVTIQPEMIFVKYDFGDGGEYNVRYIDPPGSPQARELVRSYYRGADGILAVYDINDHKTFASLVDDWLPTAGQFVSSANVPVLVLANKRDLFRGDDKKLARLLATQERSLNTGFPDRLAFVDLVRTSARQWAFPGIVNPLDALVQTLIERKAAAAPVDAGRIQLFKRDVGEGEQRQATSDCGAGC